LTRIIDRLRYRQKERGGSAKGVREEREGRKGVWSEEGKGGFRDEFRGLAGNGEGEGIEEEWEGLKERIRKAIEKVGEKGKKRKKKDGGMRSVGR